MHSLMRRAWVDVDLGALLRNGTRRVATHASVPLLPMVKADAYGLGAERVSRTLERLDPWGSASPPIAEAEELRAIAHHAARSSSSHRSFPAISTQPFARESHAVAQRRARRSPDGRRPGVRQLAIDTGMSRAGIRWDEVDCLADVVTANPPQGAFTHFHSAEKARRQSFAQEERFASALARLPIRPAMIHAENSPAIEHRGPSPWTVARPASFSTASAAAMRRRLRRNRLSSRARDRRHPNRSRRRDRELRGNVSRRRRSPDRDAWHWLRRRLSPRARQSRGSVLVAGTRVPVVGNVTMDMTMIDVTDGPVRCGRRRNADRRGWRRSASTSSEVAGVRRSSVRTRCSRSLRGRLPRRYVGVPELKRAAIVVLDGVGIGAAPDAADYGDVGSDTLRQHRPRARRAESPEPATPRAFGNIAPLRGYCAGIRARAARGA